MKKAIFAIALCVTLVGLVALSSCTPPNDARLVGKWAITVGSVSVQYCEFTADEFIVGGGTGVVTVTYDYKASKGSGQYWVAGASSVKADFTYEFGSTDDTMTLTVSGVSVSLTRMAD